MQVFHLGRAPRTKETLPDFMKWHRVTRHPLVFRGLTGSRRTPGIGASHRMYVGKGYMIDDMWKLNVMTIIKSYMNKASCFSYILESSNL